MCETCNDQPVKKKTRDFSFFKCAKFVDEEINKMNGLEALTAHFLWVTEARLRVDDGVKPAGGAATQRVTK